MYISGSVFSFLLNYVFVKTRLENSVSHRSVIAKGKILGTVSFVISGKLRCTSTQNLISLSLENPNFKSLLTREFHVEVPTEVRCCAVKWFVDLVLIFSFRRKILNDRNWDSSHVVQCIRIIQGGKVNKVTLFYTCVSFLFVAAVLSLAEKTVVSFFVSKVQIYFSHLSKYTCQVCTAVQPDKVMQSIRQIKCVGLNKTVISAPNSNICL